VSGLVSHHCTVVSARLTASQHGSLLHSINQITLATFAAVTWCLSDQATALNMAAQAKLNRLLDSVNSCHISFCVMPVIDVCLVCRRL